MTPPDESQRLPSHPASDPGDAPRADALYEQGMAYYQRRDWRKALDNFKQLKAIEPNWPGLDPLIDEASWLLQIEQVDARTGVMLEEDGVERRRRPAAVLRWAVPLLVAAGVLAVLAWWQGWLPSVGDRLEYEALYNRGQASLAVGDYQGAQEAFSSLLQLAPDRFVALAQEGLERAARLEQVALAYEEANVAIQAEDWDTAEARLRSILAVDPVYADASDRLDFVLHQREASTLFRAGVASYDAGEYSQAIAHLERLTELDSTYQRDAVRELLFVLYLRDGRALLATPDASADGIRQALARFGKALALRPRNVEAAEEQQLANRFLGIRQALDRDDLAQAEAALVDLLGRRPDYAGGQAAELAYGLLMRRGEQARSAGDDAAAALAFQQALALAVLDPSQAQAALLQLQPAPAATPEAGQPGGPGGTQRGRRLAGGLLHRRHARLGGGAPGTHRRRRAGPACGPAAYARADPTHGHARAHAGGYGHARSPGHPHARVPAHQRSAARSDRAAGYAHPTAALAWSPTRRFQPSRNRRPGIASAACI